MHCCRFQVKAHCPTRGWPPCTQLKKKTTFIQLTGSPGAPVQRETACGRTKLEITLIALHTEVISGKTLLCGPPNAISQPLYPLGLLFAAGFVWPCNLSSWERKSHERMKNRNVFFFFKNPLRTNLFLFVRKTVAETKTYARDVLVALLRSRAIVWMTWFRDLFSTLLGTP